MTISLVELHDMYEVDQAMTLAQYATIKDYWLELGKVYNNVDIRDIDIDEDDDEARDGSVIVLIEASQPFNSSQDTPMDKGEKHALVVYTDGIYDDHTRYTNKFQRGR